MSKYLSEDVIRGLLESTKLHLEYYKKSLSRRIESNYVDDSGQTYNYWRDYWVKREILEDLLERCEELDTTDIRTNAETQKPKQCKDYEEVKDEE